MLDTIRLTGSSLSSNMDFEVTKYFSYHNKRTGIEKTAVVHLTQGKNSPYRAFFDPNYNTLTVELNPHKILFGYNVYNYSQHPNTINHLVHSVANCFFSSGDCFISRADLGGVVTYENPGRALEVLEQYRRAKIEGARVAKYRHQNYTDSVFYYSKNWSAKVYNKGIELFNKAEQPEGSIPFDTYSTLRFEKTYRSGEFERIGMKKQPYKGVHIDDFDFVAWYADFRDFFTGWQHQATPYFTTEKGMKGLLSVVDQLGHLNDVAAMGVVSRTTVYRYRKEKKVNSPLPELLFKDNLGPKEKNRLNMLWVAGFSPYLHSAITKYKSSKMKKAS